MNAKNAHDTVEGVIFMGYLNFVIVSSKKAVLHYLFFAPFSFPHFNHESFLRC